MVQSVSLTRPSLGVSALTPLMKLGPLTTSVTALHSEGGLIIRADKVLFVSFALKPSSAVTYLGTELSHSGSCIITTHSTAFCLLFRLFSGNKPTQVFVNGFVRRLWQ